ncbi:DUF541 domain-containing protein [Halonotius terrestris]|uniref:DUF541 domain-containing protein n=2 Tax=Halonotius terrestris TaxID=2487750 RepID=A0A8J8P8Y3_9EURY|nr:DUF541 domain-containing protein [Halonotius terrestris]
MPSIEPQTVMNRRTALAVIGGGTVAALASPLSTASASPPPADRESTATQNRGTVRVTGTGSVDTDPDKAVISVGIEATDSEDASAVVSELATEAENLRQALRNYGIPEDNITTERYGLRHDEHDNRYEGQHRYSVEIDDPDAVGEVIDRCVAAGADTIGRIEFTISEARREQLYDEAVDAAVDDAHREAQLYTDATEQQLGEPISIETTGTNHVPIRRDLDVAVERDLAESAATRIEGGEVTVTAEVGIEYAFQ